MPHTIDESPIDRLNEKIERIRKTADSPTKFLKLANLEHSLSNGYAIIAHFYDQGCINKRFENNVLWSSRIDYYNTWAEYHHKLYGEYKKKYLTLMNK